MVIKINKRRSLFHFFEYILSAAIILNCRTMWLSIPDIRSNFELLIDIAIIVSCFMCGILQSQKGRRRINAFLVSVIVLMHMIAFLVFNSRNAIMFCYLAICDAALVFYCYISFKGQPFPSLFEKIIKIVTFLAAISSLIWLFGSVLNIIHITGYVTSTWTGSGGTVSVPTYCWIQFEPQVNSLFGVSLIRNSSIFTEAPMASFVFSIAFLLELFINPNANIKRLLILAVAIITTMSTTGYIILILALTAKYVMGKSQLSFLQVLRIIIIPIVLIVGIYVVLDLFLAKMSERSGSIRLDDFVIGFDAWRENVIFGAGYLNETVLKSRMQSWRSGNTGYSNSVFYLLSQVGIYLGWPFFIFPIRYIIIKFRTKDWKAFVFSFLVYFAMIITIVSYQYMTFVILLYFAICTNVKLEKRG